MGNAFVFQVSQGLATVLGPSLTPLCIYIVPGVQKS